MTVTNKVRKGVVFSMMLAFASVTIPMPVMAGMIDNAQLAAESGVQLQRDQLRTLMSRQDVRTALLDYGVSKADIDQRINNMTPGELNRLNGKLASLPAGGDGGGAVLTVLLILILLEVVGVIDIFPRI